MSAVALASGAKRKSNRLAVALSAVTCIADWRALLVTAFTECIRLPESKSRAGAYLPPELLSLVAEYSVACFTDMLRCSAWTVDPLLDVIPEFMRDDSYLFNYAIADHRAPPLPSLVSAAAFGGSGGGAPSVAVQLVTPASSYGGRWYAHVTDRDIRVPRLIPPDADESLVVPCTAEENFARMKRIISELLTCEGDSTAGAGGLQVYVRTTVTRSKTARVVETAEEVWMNPPASPAAAAGAEAAATTATAAPTALYLRFYRRATVK